MHAVYHDQKLQVSEGGWLVKYNSNYNEKHAETQIDTIWANAHVTTETLYLFMIHLAVLRAGHQSSNLSSTACASVRSFWTFLRL